MNLRAAQVRIYVDADLLGLGKILAGLRVQLTADGEKRLNQLAAAHLVELQRLAPVLDQLVAAADTASTDGAMPLLPGITS